MDMLLLGSTLPKNKSPFLYKSTSYIFGPLRESDEDLREKKDITEGPSVVFTRTPAVDKTIIRNSSNVCKLQAEFNSSQLFPF